MKFPTNLFFVFSRVVVLRRHEKRQRKTERVEINDFCRSRDEYEQHCTEEDYGGFEQRRRRVLEEEKANDDDEKKTFYQSYENDEYDDDDDGETIFKPPKQF
jgi:hypothetical protein